MMQIDWHSRLKAQLSAENITLIDKVRSVSAEIGLPAYLVGGIVRDLILQRPSTDLDIVIAGDAIQFAQTMQKQFDGDLLVHSRFGTSTWQAPAHAGQTHSPIDFISARREKYDYPAALPTITAGSMADDLARRDFSVNALALRIDNQQFTLLDTQNSLADIAEKQIRVLHANSFIDDPTRIFRAVRYEKRLDFTLEPHTEAWLIAGNTGIKQLSGARVWHELERIFAEENADTILQRLDQLGTLAAVAPALTWQPAFASAWRHLTQITAAEHWQADATPRLLFWLWMVQLTPEIAQKTVGRLHLPSDYQEGFNAIQTLNASLAQLGSGSTASAIDGVIRPIAKRHPTDTLLALRAWQHNTPIAQHLDWYQRELRHIQPTLDGHYLQQIGLKPGPHFKTILTQLHQAKLDGVCPTLPDEKAFIARLLAEQDLYAQ